MTWTGALLLVGLTLLITAAIAGVRGAPWLPSRRQEIERILPLANLQPGEVFVDLGCGDGRVVFAAAERYGADAYGCDISLLPYCVARIRWLFSPARSKIHLSLRDLYAMPINTADVVFCFLMPKTLERLKTKFVQELKPGAHVVTNCFRIRGWEPILAEQPIPTMPAIFVYAKPADRKTL